MRSRKNKQRVGGGNKPRMEQVRRGIIKRKEFKNVRKVRVVYRKRIVSS
jgi:hypothetical protein